MDDVREATEEFLAEKPEGETALHEILSADESGTWEFDDISVDSGTFGEIVSKDIVVKKEGSYRVADPTAVRDVLMDDDSIRDRAPSTEERRSVRDYVPTVQNRWDKNTALLFGAVCLFIVLLRTVPIFQMVFRDGTVVLAGNDPYRRLFYVEQLLASDLPAFSFTALSKLPFAVKQSNPLTITVLWWLSSLVGGTPGVAKHVVAWYPVVSALVSAVCLYVVSMRLTNDRRVSLMTVVILAIIPVHGYRTALGFGDHHAFDYLVLAVTTLAVVTLLQSKWPSKSVDRTTATWIAILALSIWAQIFSWRAAPLILVPIGLYVVAQTLVDVAKDRSPAATLSPILAGLLVAALLTYGTYLGLGWMELYSGLAPALLAVGGVAVVLIGELGYRREVGLKVTSVLLFVGSILTVIVAFTLVPGISDAVFQFSSYLEETGSSGIAETVSIFSTQIGGPIGPLFYFGFVLFFAIPYLGLATFKLSTQYRPELLILVIYAWFFFALSIVQVRFAGQLALYLSFFGAAGFLHLASAIDIIPDFVPFSASDKSGTKPNGLSLPERRTILYLLLLFLLIGGFSFVQLPIKMDQLAVDDQTYQTASWLDEHAEAQNTSYPDNYVFSAWSQNRVYNYFVSGQSESYTFALENYDSFLAANDSEKWYERLRDRVGYVVIEPANTPVLEGSIQDVLHEGFGSDSESTNGVEHYRAVYRNDDLFVFSLVPGATITGSGPANSTVTVETEVEIPGDSFIYEQRVPTTMDGRYAATVPYPGRYQDSNQQTVRVAAESIESGQFVGEKSQEAHWSFEAGQGEVAFDRSGNNHGRVTGDVWGDGIDGRGLDLDGESDKVVVTESETLNPTDDFTVSMWFRTKSGADYVEDTDYPRLFGTLPGDQYRNVTGYGIMMNRGQITGVVGSETDNEVLFGPRVDDSNWHHAVLTRDGETVRLYVDGQVVDTRQFSGSPVANRPLVIGSAVEAPRHFPGQIDEVTFKSSAVSDTTIQRWYTNTGNRSVDT